ncbi:MAG TPA: 50S ribosomal protein L22 [Candidatus Pacearchaeota archaeon]|nr:50S ribosomal protein L22 [Candidatus Pacearchaeota archaeon]
MSEVLVTAKLNRLRVSPRKVRLVVDLVRGKSVEEARQILKYTVRASAQPVAKLLESAVANARHNYRLAPESLKISRITVDEGQTYKRFRPESRGRVAPIHKKTSHITLTLVGQSQEAEKEVKGGKEAQSKAKAKKK